MRDDFRPIKQALLAAARASIQANAALMTANQALVALGEALTAANEATNTASDEHEDLRETVHRLETLVTDLVSRLPPPPSS